MEKKLSKIEEAHSQVPPEALTQEELQQKYNKIMQDLYAIK